MSDVTNDVDPRLLEGAVAIGVAGYTAYSNSLSAAVVGNSAPRVRRYYERTSKPQPGDLVLEITSFALWVTRGDLARAAQCVGTLVSNELEFRAWSEEAWSEEAPGYRERVWTIELWVNDKTLRWENAMFISIPRNFEEERKWTRD